MKRFCAVCVALCLSACAALPSLWRPSEIYISQTQLQNMLAQRFPLEKRWLDRLDVQVAQPQLRLMPESNRIGSSLMLTVKNPFGRDWTGSLAFNSGLRFDAPTRSIRLTDPKVESVQLQGLPEVYARSLNGLSALVLEELLKEAPIHTFSAEQLRLGNVDLKPRAIKVTPQGLSVSMDP